MLPTGYLRQVFAEVPKPAELFRDMGNNTLTAKVRAIYDSSKLLFGINSIKMYISQESKIYKFSVISDKDKFLSIASLFYIPEQRRLDVWSSGDYLPIIQFKAKSIAFKNYSEFYDKLKFDKLFTRLITNL